MKFKSFSNPITEGAVKSSMEDWLYDLPKAVISEIKKKYGKILAAANKPPYKTVFSADVKDGIGKILMANKVKPLMGSHKESVGAITMSFDTYHGAVNEEIELDEASNTIPDSAIVLTQNLQKKTITFTWYDGNTEKWIEREVPQDEAPGFYTRAGTAMKARKTDKYGNLLKVPVTDIDAAKRAKEMEAVSARNIVTAKDLLNTIEKKKVGTKFELYGTKNGKEHTLKVRKSMLMAQVVYFTTGDREVLFQATASGLTVMDKKTRRPLLSGGNDMIWESTDLTDVGHMMIEISEATEKPKILERLIGQLKSKGMEVGQATAIATSTLQKSGSLKSGSHTLTKKGAKRQGMGAAGRAKDRAATESGKPTNSYAYNPQTNKATLRT